MFKMVVIICLIPIALALAARWWFGVRVLALEGGRACRCDLKRWLPSPGDEAIVHRADQTARDFGPE
jgi:hypothetical protein